MFVIKYKTFFITLSALFVLAGISAAAVFGLPLGIDFKGGSQVQVLYTQERPPAPQIKTLLTQAGFTEATVQPTGERGIIIKTQSLTEPQKQALVAALGTGVTEQGVTTIGPSVGAELKHKAVLSIILVLCAIICFVAYAFRKVSRPVSSWKYGLAVIIALIHDIAIPLGAFAVISHVKGVEVDTLFVVALLTTLALSISDTIVVFDRIREHLSTDAKKGKPFETIVGESLNETFARSINTSLMVLVMVITLALVGPKSTQLFATVLAIGMFFGTYSSIFLASPLLVLFERMQKTKAL